MSTAKWKHDEEECKNDKFAQDVCEGMYSDKCDDVHALWGLHERHCTRFKNKARDNAIVRLKHLVPKPNKALESWMWK